MRSRAQYWHRMHRHPSALGWVSCYGTLHAKNVPVVLRSFTYTLPEDTDYVTVEVNGESISVPTLVLVSIELSPQLTPSKVKSKFNITSFASGRLLNGGNTGGFI